MSTDGYSSDEDEQKFSKESSVLLGFTDIEIEEEEEEPTIEDSFIGGTPVWLHPESQPEEDLLQCKNCSQRMALILQAFSPLEGTLYDRVIYVFGCQKPKCRRKQGSIRAIRGISKDPKKISELKRQDEEEIKQLLDDKLKLDKSKNILFGDQNSGTNPFGGEPNPFASNDNPFSSVDPFDAPKATPESKKTFESFASVAQKAAPKPQQKTKATKFSESVPRYPGYFIYVDEEKFNKKKQDKSLSQGFKLDESAFDLEAEVSAGGLSSDTQAISNSLHDEDFQHFEEVISYNPLQVLRYDLGGKPLLFSSKDDTAAKVLKNLVPRPGYNPSSERHFELQIMPKIILDLEKDSLDIADGIEWVTIIVYSDVEDYVPKLDKNHIGYVEEWVGVQWEEITR